jgi:hypothetical protein
MNDIQKEGTKLPLAPQVRMARSILSQIEKQALEQIINAVGGIGRRGEVDKLEGMQLLLIKALASKGYIRLYKKTFWTIRAP